MSSIKTRKVLLKNNYELIVRTAYLVDAENIYNLMKSILKEKVFAIHEIDEFPESIKSYRSKIEKFKKAPGKLFLVAEINNVITGFVNFNNWDTRKTMHTGFLSVYIKKEYRGLGIGKILMNELIKWAKQNKMIKKMSLAVFGSNKNAISHFDVLLLFLY